jgi:hypothetical protein
MHCWLLEHPSHSVFELQIGVVGVTQSADVAQPPQLPLEVQTSLPGQSSLLVEHFWHVLVVVSQIGVAPLQPAFWLFGSQAAHWPFTHSDLPFTFAQSVTSRHSTQRDAPLLVSMQWSSVPCPLQALPELGSH